MLTSAFFLDHLLLCPEPVFVNDSFRSLGIDFKESILPAYVAWRAGTTNRVIIPARSLEWIPGLHKRLKIRALISHQSHFKFVKNSRWCITTKVSWNRCRDAGVNLTTIMSLIPAANLSQMNTTDHISTYTANQGGYSFIHDCKLSW